MGEKKRMAINMISQFISFVVGLGISFILTRQIAKMLGKDIYGFVGLGNTFTSYVTVFTVALNSMLNRYVTIELRQKNHDKASTYFSSVAIADMVIALILVIPATIVVLFIDKFFDVPAGHVGDIQLLWVFIFANFLLSLATSAFGTATYATNRLDLSAKRSVESNLIKAAVLILAYVFFAPKVWYMGLAAFLCGAYCSITNMRYCKKLTPQLSLKKIYFKFKAVKELVSVGVWSSINQLTQTLINGLDLMFANKLLGALEMSLMSYSKTVPVQLISLISMVAGVFAPQMTIAYAEGNMEKFKDNTNMAIKICGFFCSVPILGFMIFGTAFFQLWLPMLTPDEIKMVQILSMLALLPNVFSVYIFPLYSVNNITRKLKVPVMVTLAVGIINLITVPILVNYTNLGLLGIKIVSSVLLTARVLFFVPTYAAHSIGCKWTTFYKPLARGMVSNIMILLLFNTVNKLVAIDSWLMLIIVGGICGAAAYVINYIVVLNQNEKLEVLKMVKKVFKRG